MYVINYGDIDIDKIMEILKQIYDSKGYKIKILDVLMKGPRKFSELSKEIGVHQNILARALKELVGEAYGNSIPLVTRLSNNKRSQYAITIYGKYVYMILKLLSIVHPEGIIRYEDINGVSRPVNISLHWGLKYLNYLRRLILEAHSPDHLLELLIGQDIGDEKAWEPRLTPHRLTVTRVHIKHLIIHPGTKDNEITLYLYARDLPIYIQHLEDRSIYYSKIVVSKNSVDKLISLVRDRSLTRFWVDNLIIIDNINNEWHIKRIKEFINQDDNKFKDKWLHVNILDIILFLSNTDSREYSIYIDLNILPSIFVNWFSGELVTLSNTIRLHIVPGHNNFGCGDINVYISDEFVRGAVININVYRYHAEPEIRIETHGTNIVLPSIFFRKHVFGGNNKHEVIDESIVCRYPNTSSEWIEVGEILEGIPDSLSNSYQCIRKYRDNGSRIRCKPKLNIIYNTPPEKICLLPPPFCIITPFFDINTVIKRGIK